MRFVPLMEFLAHFAVQDETKQYFSSSFVTKSYKKVPLLHAVGRGLAFLGLHISSLVERNWFDIRTALLTTANRCWRARLGKSSRSSDSLLLLRLTRLVSSLNWFKDLHLLRALCMLL